MKDTLFINGDDLSIGVFVSTWEEGGLRYIKYRPINSFRTVVIGGVNPDALIPIDRISQAPGTWESYKYLAVGVDNRSRFMERYINREIPNRLRKMQELNRDIELERASVQEQKTINLGGTNEMLKDVGGMLKTLEESVRKKDEERDRFRNRRTD